MENGKLKRNFQLTRGFTLVEILVVIAIMAIMGLILTEVFIRSLRGGNKAEVLAILKQNGQSVLENMDKNIRGSDSIACTDNLGEVLVIEKDGLYTRYRLITGQLAEDHPVLPENTSQDTFLTYVCNNSNYPPEVIPAILTDSEKVSVVGPQEGSTKIFTTTKASGFKAVVTINFLLKPGQSIPKTIGDQIDPVSFVTTIQVR